MIVHRVLFVCTGNICRSPTAEGVARTVAERMGLGRNFQFDSAGIQGHHVGDPPDRRSIAAAAKRGYDLSKQRARRVNDFDFVAFEHVLVMDHSHLTTLRAACPPQHRHKLKLFLDFSRSHDDEEVPDPYYGGAQGFEFVLDLIEDAVQGLISELTAK